jgi:5-(carboxyamino)imidazole ribonucleotide synthase
VIIGVLGGGQLGRMLALAAHPLGIQVRCYDPSEHPPAGAVTETIRGEWSDAVSLNRFAKGLFAVTYEFENVPVDTVALAGRSAPIFPPVLALETAQDRLREKRFFQSLGIETAPFAEVNDRAGLDRALKELGTPAILKTVRFGYDGKGQFKLQSAHDADAAWKALGGTPLVLEGFIEFERELSVIAVRSMTGETACYPLFENQHAEGILRLSVSPAPGVSAALQEQASLIATRALDALGYVGVLAIELFQCGERLVVNEMAPRVHNSGHGTIEGAETSQFENHIRAVARLPLGSTRSVGHSAMINIIGRIPDSAALLAIEGAHLHLYGKSEAPGRKLGHVTARSDDAADLETAVAAVQRLIAQAPHARQQAGR